MLNNIMQSSSFSSKKLAPCKNFSWLLNWLLAIFLAPTFWEPEQPLNMAANQK
jgi:hypothetical protein